MRHALVRTSLLRMLLLACIALILTGAVLKWRYDELDKTLVSRNWALLHQLAPTVDYAVRSGNREIISRIALSTANQPDVNALAIFDTKGGLIHQAGVSRNSDKVELGVEPHVRENSADSLILLHVPILPPALDGTAKAERRENAIVGHAVLEISTATIEGEKHLTLAAILVVLFGGALLSGVVGMRKLRHLLAPVERMSAMVDSTGDSVPSADARQQTLSVMLMHLEQGVGKMAARIRAWEQSHRAAEAVTEKLKAEKEEAEKMAFSRSRFLARASHDLRQPLHALGLFVARLAQMKHPDEANQLLARVETSVSTVQDLLNTLLDLSRLDTGIVQLSQRSFHIGAFLERITIEHGEMARTKGLKFSVRHCAFWGRSDPILLESILRNLIGNAIRYTEHGGVLVACRRRDGALRIEVWDTGRGIPETAQRDIFDEFVRLGSSGGNTTNGFGLGLAIVERTARLLGHIIHLRSCEGQGSVFAITIPLARADDATQAELLPHIQSNSLLTGASVLVIDDDEPTCRATADLLSSWGCCVVATTTYREAISCLDSGFRPDAVLSDYRLADTETGIDVVEGIRCGLGNPALPAILLTGDADIDLVARAEAVGLSVMNKPARPARLRVLLNRMIATASAPAKEN